MLFDFGWRIIVVVAGLWVAAFFQSLAGANYPVYFTANVPPQSDPAAVTPMERTLLDQIDSAAFTIDAALYEFDRPSVRDALLAANERGVHVRIVTDNNTHYSEDDGPTYQALADAGIEIVDDYGKGDDLRIHDKYLILDGQKVWTGSANLTTDDLTQNHNNSLLLTSADVAQMFQNDFNQLVAQRFGLTKTASPITQTTYNNHLLEALFSPQDAALDKIIAEVNAAQTAIDFSILQLKDDALRDALLAAQARGVQVRGLLDADSAEDSDSDDEALCAGGVSLKIEGTPGRMHNKFMLIDPGTQRERVITGSLNWTPAARTASSENTLVLHDSNAAQAYVQAFATLWAVASPQVECNVAPPPAPNAWVYLPAALRQ